mgnify:CR=1 FL=1
MTAAVPGLVDAVSVGPFRVSDLPSEAIAAQVVQGAAAARLRGRCWVTFALHVGGLNSRRDARYVAAMRSADLVYADGMSVVMLARLAGARSIERSGTTDLGWTVLRALNDALGRPARVALVGGPPGLTERAGQVLEREAGVDVVFTDHGYHDDWDESLAALRGLDCDVLVVGLGAPFEMVWVEEHRAALPACAVMTCGGWFGFITQAERRAPMWAQRAGLEWAFRLMQSPGRLWRRYAVGVVSTAVLAARITQHSRRQADVQVSRQRPGSVAQKS